ncbi:hypothetical protein BJX99DRAFT_262429 [Aspergillus californicus]
MFPAEEPSQLIDDAFTVTGLAYKLEDVFNNRPNPMIVTAYSPSSTNFTYYLKGNPDRCFPKEISTKGDSSLGLGNNIPNSLHARIVGDINSLIKKTLAEYRGMEEDIKKTLMGEKEEG